MRRQGASSRARRLSRTAASDETSAPSAVRTLPKVSSGTVLGWPSKPWYSVATP